MNKYNFTIKTIKEAADIVARMRAEGFRVDFKENNPKDLVTTVDTAVEKFIKQKIQENFPDDAVYGEENGLSQGSGKFSWAIDPIDGTANFSRGIPHYAICIGLLENNIPIVGAVYNPVTRELFSFEKGRGAFLNDKKITVSGISDLSEAQVFFTAGRRAESREWAGESYKNLLANAMKTRNFASSALDTCFIAAGRIEAAVYGTLNTIDIASAIGILLEAGGKIYNEAGEEVEYSTKRQKIYLCNNEKTYAQLKELL